MDRAFPHQWPSTAEQLASSSQEFIGVSDIARFLKRYVATIIACLAAALLVAWFYNSTTDPAFTASAQILIEPRLPQHLQDGGEVNLSLDTAQVESQIAVMQSEKIAQMVLDQLKLVDDPKFNRSQAPILTERVKKIEAILVETLGLRNISWFASGVPETPKKLTEYQKSRRTMEIFRSGLDIRRVGVSYAIDISFTSLDPEGAARIANATADAFVREQIETKAEAAKEGGAWLEMRLQQLRDQMNKAMAKAQEFRSRHDYSVSDESEVQDGVKAEPTLEELEVTAETYQKMYESFLQAYTNSVSQQSYPVADARVITAATAPLDPSAPRPKLTLVFGAVAGLIFGIGLSFVRYMFDWTITSPRQIRDGLGIECVGELPSIGRARENGVVDEVRRYPHSRYSDSLRKARTEISLAETDHPIKFLGLTAVSGDSSKSSVASNLATLYSMSGLKTLVIDADVRRPTMTTRLLGPRGSLKPCQDPVRLNIVGVPGRPFDLLPGPVVNAKNLLAPDNMEAFLSDLAACDLAAYAYDIVILDLPTLASGADILKVASILDGVVMVAEWGNTSLDTLRNLVRTLQTGRAPILGVLLTRARAITSTHRKA
ncbi:GNVR domain-containing protein [Mesorhizobium abyssinicae]|uniref:GumC family protein n=1 Tax=Mesorhizobium TaxID=68287 RepID=UPI000FD2279B|nr:MULTISPECIES: GNVR domain-containing protein [Mesorhizobium]RVC64646.1 ATPase [Mesorhizobium sp. M4B.F.Ca.ET.088.02.2.1]MDX8434632.1 GNVR domain-containing protein [Mesorhizobium abyssinicae]RWF34141.1 MAG: ATPase [Mesorhizobium sp.]RWF42896.1 MAG: ATPase [Mesorhizobium sp.]TIX19179.1 MAG: ATPase [Mesorhizobium sp.]